MLIADCDVLFLPRQVIDHLFDRVQVVPSPTSLSEVALEVYFKQVGSELSIPCALPIIALVCILNCSNLLSFAVEVLLKVVFVFVSLWHVVSRFVIGASILLYSKSASSTSSTSTLLQVHFLRRLFPHKDIWSWSLVGVITIVACHEGALSIVQTSFHLPWKFCQRQCL